MYDLNQLNPREFVTLEQLYIKKRYKRNFLHWAFLVGKHRHRLDALVERCDNTKPSNLGEFESLTTCEFFCELVDSIIAGPLQILKLEAPKLPGDKNSNARSKSRATSECTPYNQSNYEHRTTENNSKCQHMTLCENAQSI